MQRTTELMKCREELDKRPDTSLEDLWKQTKINFKEQTGHDLDNRIPIDELRQKSKDVDKMQVSKVKSAFERAKYIFAKVFKVIWNFWEFFQPALKEIPFAGAGVEFLAKAIDLLIRATQNYQAIFVKAAQLFEQVGFFSMRFEMLMEAESEGARLHPKYTQFLHSIMAHMVGCVALYIKLNCKPKLDPAESRRKRMWDKAQAAGQVAGQFMNTMATGDDEGVGDQMVKLQDLIEQEGRLSTALILASVLKIHKDVGAVRKSVSTVMDKLSLVHNSIIEYSTSLTSQHVDKLKSSLYITHEPWNDAFRACAERCVAGTGEWLLLDNKFNAWATTRNDAPHIFAIEAGSNFGKTYLTTIVIAHLHKRALEEVKTQSVIAFYYFNSASKDLTAAAVIRAIAFQLCTHNTRFFDFFRSLHKTSSDASSSLGINLWTSLIVEVSSQLTDLSVFIILDGLEMLAKEQLQILSDVLASPNKANQGLRILLTGNTRCLESVSQRVGHSLVKITLDNTYPHRGDVSLAAEAELARCDVFSDELDDPEVRECMARTRNSLVQAVSGDYYLLQSQLREIRHLWSTDEIDRVLNRAVKGRNATIERHLSNLAVRVSETELFRLRDGLHLLAVLNILEAPMPHIVVLGQYLASGRDSATSRTKVRTAYSGLVSIDTEGYLSLATDEMTSFLMPDMKASQAIASQTQTVNIKQAFYATFNPTFLKENGIDDEFFDSRSRLNHLADFKVERNVAMAKVAIHFIDCLSKISTTQRKQTSHENYPLHSLSTFAREILPKLLQHIDTSQLVDPDRIVLGYQVTRLFFEDNMFDVFWPLEVLSQYVTTWGKNEQYFDAVYRILKHHEIIKHLEGEPRSKSWATELQQMSKASDLQSALSKMVARRWLLSKSFWTQDDIRNFFLWFSTVQELGFIKEKKEKKEKKVAYEPYDPERITGWFTPPNWEKIKAWVLSNVDIDDDRASFDIQRAAVLLAFGGKSEEPAEILEPYRDMDWRANVWLAEATSLHDNFDAAYDAVEECLTLLLEFDVDQATITKVNDCFLDWIYHWDSLSREMQVREKMIKLNEQKPGILSSYMWARTLEIAFYVKGRDAGLDFFQAQYQSKKPTICETFIRQAAYNYLHIPLSRTLTDDPEGSRLRYLCGIYKDVIAFCDEKPMLSTHDMHRARVRLSYWLGRLFFVSKGKPKLIEVIARWEGLLKDFCLNPSTRDLDVLIPIIKHLCSAYIQVLRGEYTDIEADHIISQVTKLHNVTRSWQEPIALKLYFRVSLCLARIYVVRGETAKAREILKEHADSAFSMLSQRNNLSLFGIGWLYLASILTVLDQDDVREKWAWSKFMLLQQLRQENIEYYAEASERGDNPSLDIAVKQRIDAIKTSEEYNCFDSLEIDLIDYTWAGDFYLPWFATIACDGQDCKATSKKTSGQPAPINSEPLQRVDEITFNNISWPNPGELTESDTFRLEEGFLPAMGCSKDHSALIVRAAYDDYDDDDGDDDDDDDDDEGDGVSDIESVDATPWEVSDKDMEIVAKESKKWNTNSYCG
ncbi:neutral amino acid permease [Fusarium flagelliforme]|uniref:Neutral amino acid permease n=1 Tax=Fusarium flagelliforme TaxID=2675880 RepID=A0A395MZM7_9HYPO|nr:neutral amino acid permease [Fusarium flagelliforme]